MTYLEKAKLENPDMSEEEIACNLCPYDLGYEDRPENAFCNHREVYDCDDCWKREYKPSDKEEEKKEEKEEKMKYFVVHIVDGTDLDFDKKCCKVECFDSSNTMLRFKDGRGDCLAIIPVDKILYVLVWED